MMMMMMMCITSLSQTRSTTVTTCSFVRLCVVFRIDTFIVCVLRNFSWQAISCVDSIRPPCLVNYRTLLRIDLFRVMLSTRASVLSTRLISSVSSLQSQRSMEMGDSRWS